MTGALLRYRIAAYVVGILLVLLCVAMYLKYGPQDDDGFMWIAMIHGYFYLVYLGLAFDLYRRVKWPVGVLVAMILAGLVPGMVFIVERRIVARGLSAPRTPRDAGVAKA